MFAYRALAVGGKGAPIGESYRNGNAMTFDRGIALS